MHASRKLAAVLVSAALGTITMGTTMNATAATVKLSADNPFARESTLPYKLPPLDKLDRLSATWSFLGSATMVVSSVIGVWWVRRHWHDPASARAGPQPAVRQRRQKMERDRWEQAHQQPHRDRRRVVPFVEVVPDADRLCEAQPTTHHRRGEHDRAQTIVAPAYAQ